jgi:D-alanyl-D-alanine carboxypeptidase (penicillin-binding protein 5/6)
MIHKRFAIFLVVFWVFCLLPPAEASAAKFRRQKVQRENYRSAIVMDARTGRILYAENADRPVPPASVAKILSLYLAYEALSEGTVHLQDRVRISRKAGRTGGSRMFLEPGSEVTLDELIKGVAIISANDAAVALAEHITGDLHNFVYSMNLKAWKLGMLRSRFKNPHGLPARGQVTTARDIAVLSRDYLGRFPQALSIHSTKSYTYHDITQSNRNLLLKHYPGTDGIKTGFVSASGYNLAATAVRGNTRLIAVVLGSRTPAIRLRETTRLLNQCFSKVQREAATAPSRPDRRS